MTRTDHESGTDRIAEAARNLKEDVIVNLQADEPEIDVSFLQILAGALLEQPAVGPRFSMATLATYIFDETLFKNPNVVKAVVAESTERALYFSRAPVPFPRDGESGATIKRRGSDGTERRVFGFHHIGMYAYRKEFLAQYVTLRPSRLEKIERLEQLRALENGFEIRVVLVDHHVPGIDTPEDYESFVQRCKQLPRAKS
jgi:3-deoxy-manno-octulosonate cytidylyltransferase (CMP-KDO synthetase)